MELRNYVCESTPLCIYENFHFEHEGKPLPEYNEIGDKFKSDIRLSIVLDEFDNHSSRYHHNKICDMLHDPYLWAIAWAPLHLERNSA